MKKIIRLYPAIPQLVFVFSPLIIISLIFPFFVLVFITILAWSLYNYFISPETSEEPWLILIYNDLIVFLVLLFFSIIVCSFQTEKNENVEYFIPGFLNDFFSPNEIALKLVLIALIFIITLILKRKAKELF